MDSKYEKARKEYLKKWYAFYDSHKQNMKCRECGEKWEGVPMGCLNPEYPNNDYACPACGCITKGPVVEDKAPEPPKQSLPESKKIKNFSVKNYKGNLLESVKKFQKKFPESRILEAREEDGALKIKADESFTKSGEIHFDENGECRDNIKSIWHHIHKYPKDKDTVYANGNTYIYCVAETSGLTEHFWAVYEGQDVRSKSDTSISVPDYLIKRLPENVKTNESLDRREEDELYYDVLNWFYDNYSAKNDISDKQWKDLANGVDKNAEIFRKMLDDLKMQNADDEVKDKMHEFLVDFADAEVN